MEVYTDHRGQCDIRLQIINDCTQRYLAVVTDKRDCLWSHPLSMQDTPDTYQLFPVAHDGTNLTL